MIDRVDPANLTNERPTVVDIEDQGAVYVADARVRENGWLWMKQWNNRTAKVPPHRVNCLKRVETERYGERNETSRRSKRVADEQWREKARAISEDAGAPAADSQQELVADGG